MLCIYVIYDSENNVWDKAFINFENAVEEVSKLMYIFKTNFGAGCQCKFVSFFEVTTTTDSGCLVARCNDCELNIYIKKLELH
jgi:hypothetical protein